MQQILQELQLDQRFPGVDFETHAFRENGDVVATVEWPPSQHAPKAATVADYLRGSSSLPVAVSGERMLEIRIPQPDAEAANHPAGGRPQRPAKRSRPRRVHPRSDGPSFGAQGLWSISDLEIIRTISDRWAASLKNRSTVLYYTTGMVFLTIVSGYLAYALDIHPSYVFGQHLAAALVTDSKWIGTSALVTVIFLLSITPNLLEFFASGLAVFGNVIVDIAIKAALLFDATTDAPAAYAISRAAVAFFLPDDSFLHHTLSVLVAVPVLFFNTVVVEILFLSFLTATVLLTIRYFQVR